PRGHELRAFGPARTGCLPFTRRPLYLVSYEGIVSPVRFRMHTAQRLHDGASCLWGDEDIGAAVRCRSGPPALRGRGRSRARRHGFRGWARTSEGRGQGPAGDADAPPGTGTGDASRTRTPRGLSSRGLPVASLP